MKRSQSGVPYKRTGIIAKDLTTAQLAGVGKIAFAYNEAELWVHLIFVSAIGVEWSIGGEVSRRINGVDGLIDIIKSGLKSLNCPKDAFTVVCDVLGEGGFQSLKKYRDSIIHARIIEAQAGIGISHKKRGKFDDILLTESALNGVFERLEIMRLELSEISKIAIILRVFRDRHPDIPTLVDVFPPKDHREQSWQRTLNDVQESLSQLRVHGNQRQRLPPLPEFPPEFPDAKTARRLAIAAALLSSNDDNEGKK